MGWSRALIFIAFLLGWLALPASSSYAQATVLYETDFETFEVGAGKLAGTDGWMTNITGTTEAYGIDQDIGGGTGRSGYVGYQPPPGNARLVSVHRPVNVSPLTSGSPIIEFSALIGISDSQLPSTTKDRFYITFYNLNSQSLAWLTFDNTSDDKFIFRNDGVTSTNTGGFFNVGEIQYLHVRINFLTNRWSADLDFAPLFIDAPFHSGTRPLSLRTVAAEWYVVTAGSPGNNWMFFDDWTIASSPEAAPKLTLFEKAVAGGMTLKWTGEYGYSYRVQYSSDLLAWYDSLPGSLLTPAQTGQPMSYTDPSAPAGNRYYRIKRIFGALAESKTRIKTTP